MCIGANWGILITTSHPLAFQTNCEGLNDNAMSVLYQHWINFFIGTFI